MDIFKLIHKIRNLTIEDKFRLGGKALVISIVTIIGVVLCIGSIKVITNLLNSLEQEEIPDHLFVESEQTDTQQIKDSKFETPTSQQKEEFNKFNCIEFSNIEQKDGIISVDIKNTSDSPIEDISVGLYNSSNDLLSSTFLKYNKTIKPNEEIRLEGFVSEEVEIKTYTYSKDNEYITINLENKSAMTDSNRAMIIP